MICFALLQKWFLKQSRKNHRKWRGDIFVHRMRWMHVIFQYLVHACKLCEHTENRPMTFYVLYTQAQAGTYTCPRLQCQRLQLAVSFHASPSFTTQVSIHHNRTLAFYLNTRHLCVHVCNAHESFFWTQLRLPPQVWGGINPQCTREVGMSRAKFLCWMPTSSRVKLFRSEIKHSMPSFDLLSVYEDKLTNLGNHFPTKRVNVEKMADYIGKQVKCGLQYHVSAKGKEQGESSRKESCQKQKETVSSQHF